MQNVCRNYPAGIRKKKIIVNWTLDTLISLSCSCIKFYMQTGLSITRTNICMSIIFLEYIS
jgi:hypothetical protein